MLSGGFILFLLPQLIRGDPLFGERGLPAGQFGGRLEVLAPVGRRQTGGVLESLPAFGILVHISVQNARQRGCLPTRVVLLDDLFKIRKLRIWVLCLVENLHEPDIVRPQLLAGRAAFEIHDGLQALEFHGGEFGHFGIRGLLLSFTLETDGVIPTVVPRAKNSQVV